MAIGARIASLEAEEILDSRGFPTLQINVVLADGTRAQAGVPSGASTGAREAVERRDQDMSRYGGKGVREVAQSVSERVSPILAGMRADEQRAIDDALIALDGTPAKSSLGGNVTVGISLACARAAAWSHGLELYEYLGGANAHVMPVPMFNVLNGGKHADGGSDIQEFKIVPAGAPTFSEALRYGAETYHALGRLLRESGASTAVGDEGGFAPDLPANTAYLDAIMRAIELAGYRPGEDIFIGIDPAANSFLRNGAYALRRDGLSLSSAGLIDYWKTWARSYPILSLEDPLAEDDWEGFRAITEQLGSRLQIVGDDLFVTNWPLVERGVKQGCCNCVLIKPDQVGTLTEAMDTARLAMKAGYACMVSHRSGETEDASIADLAVALGCGQIKAGAPARGERVAKYNRLLAIERILAGRAAFPGMDAFRR